MTEASEWHRVAKASDITEAAPLSVRVGNRLIALYRIGGRIYATDNICSHEFAELSDGILDGEYIECPLHQARFHVPTGKASSAPASEDIDTFPVRVESDEVLVGLTRK